MREGGVIGFAELVVGFTKTLNSAVFGATTVAGEVKLTLLAA